MNERLRSAGRALANSPGLQLLVGGAILAVAFPSHAAGSIGLAVLAGALGIGIALAWPHAPAWLRKPPEQIASALVVTLVVVIGLTVFWDTMTESPDWQMGDWGPQRAVLANIMPSLPGVHAPVWNHLVSTGDAPLELYPSLAYYVTGHVALALGLENDLPLAMMVVAVLVHLAIAAATAAVAMRVAPKPVALLIGLLVLVDSGAVAHGGTVGLFRWGLLHSALALACSTVAAIGVVGALQRPRLSASITIWLGTALATAAHPAGLIAAAASVIALVAVAILAADVPPRRALIAIGHVVLGVALSAWVWAPLAARILDYGQHFPNPLRPASRLLEDMLQWPSPMSAFAAFEYIGYFGILAALWSRRAAPVFVAASAFVLLLGLCDSLYLSLELAPGQGVARLGTERLAQLARPFVWAASAYGIATLGKSALASWRGAARNQKLVGIALLSVIAGATLRSVPAFWDSASNRATTEARVVAPDPLGRMALGQWATERARELKPDAWARALFEEDTHEHFHLTAETGLPTLHIGPQPDLLLRERIEDLSEASLRRFDIRWVIAIERSPSIGDPLTEKQFGSYRVREVGGWDGKFARIERGTGEVRVTRLDSDAVEVEVTGTAQPVLVALGTGYYPRWRAQHATGLAEPVYAYPSEPNGKLHVVSAWLMPGRTTFTCDGPLPSDHDGRLLSLAALVAALAALAVWSRRRWRHRALRLMARQHQKVVYLGHMAIKIGVPAVLLGLFLRTCIAEHRSVRGLALGHGIRATATVEARRVGGDWESCGYSRITGTFDCNGLLTAYDGTTTLINDAAPSWPFVTPAIIASADTYNVEMRIRLHAHLDGVYHAAVSDGTTAFSVEGEAERTIDSSAFVYDDRGDRTIEIQTAVPITQWAFTFVREDTLVPDRPFLAGPPDRPAFTP